MDTSKLLTDISNKLSVLIMLNLKNNEGVNTKEKVKLIAKFGFSNREIAEMVGTTKESAAVLKGRK